MAQTHILLYQVGSVCVTCVNAICSIYFTVPMSLDTEPLLSSLMDKVAAVIPHKFVTVGLQLGLTPDELQAICLPHQSLEDQSRIFGLIVDKWRIRGSPPYTWKTIIVVLRSDSVGEVMLSEQLTSWITSTSGNLNSVFMHEDIIFDTMKWLSIFNDQLK